MQCFSDCQNALKNSQCEFNLMSSLRIRAKISPGPRTHRIQYDQIDSEVPVTHQISPIGVLIKAKQ